MRCPMATDEMGNMRECRLDCAWLVREPGTATCAVANLAVTHRTALIAFELDKDVTTVPRPNLEEAV